MTKIFSFLFLILACLSAANSLAQSIDADNDSFIADGYSGGCDRFSANTDEAIKDAKVSANQRCLSKELVAQFIVTWRLTTIENYSSCDPNDSTLRKTVMRNARSLYRCVPQKQTQEPLKKFVLGGKLDPASQSVILEDGDSYDVRLGSKIDSVDFNQIWPHVPYPVESIQFRIKKTQCPNIKTCNGTDFVSIEETHITGMIVNRTARISYQIQSNNGLNEFAITLEATSGEKIIGTLNYGL